jgi:hypothetical protein
MSDPQPVIIRTIEDYKKAAADLAAGTQAIVALGKAEGWPNQKFVDETAKFHLPYLMAQTDPANPIVGIMGLEKEMRQLQEQGNNPRLVDASAAPIQYAIIESEVKTLNAIHGNVNYPVPKIIVATGRDSMATFDKLSDTIIIDASLFDHLKDTPPTRSLLGHELDHRYQRDAKTMLQVAKTYISNSWRVPLTPHTIENANSNESLSDYRGSQLSSPTATSMSLMGTFESGGYPISEYALEKWGMTDLMAAGKRYMALSPQEKQEMRAGYDALSVEEFKLLNIRALKNEAAVAAKSNHPSMIERLESQASLAEHPELLNATHIKFDGHANIIEVEVAGNPYTPKQIDAINRDGDQQIAKNLSITR